MQRRTFLQQSGLAFLGGVVSASVPLSCSNTNTVSNIGLQLYSLRDVIAQDGLLPTLDRIRAIGYQILEGWKYAEGQFLDMPPADFKKALDEREMTLYSNHISLEEIESDDQRALETAAAIGNTYVIIPYLSEERRNPDDYQRLAELLNRVGEQAKSLDLTLGYHNHAFEFEPLPDGTLALDYLIQATEPDLVQFELDLYWAFKANKNPLDYFAAYPGRFPMWHVKDMDNSPEQFFASVGSGTIDWAPIFAAQKQSGLKQFFVEQDKFRNTEPLDQVTKSYAYLSQLQY